MIIVRMIIYLSILHKLGTVQGVGGYIQGKYDISCFYREIHPRNWSVSTGEP